jgi:hypothetical protein
LREAGKKDSSVHHDKYLDKFAVFEKKLGA